MIRNWLTTGRSHALFLLAVLLLAACSIFVRLQFVPLVMSTDGITYIESAQLLLGEGVTAHPERLLKPLGPLAIALFAKIFSGNYLGGFIALNAALYLIFAAVAWYFVRAFFKDDHAALYGAVILFSSYPLLKYGLDYYTDLGSMLLYVVALMTIIIYSHHPSRRNILLASIAIAAGLLWKEYSVLAGATLGLVALTQSGISVRERMFHLGLLALIVLSALGVAQYIVYIQFHFTYLDWYRIGAGGMASAISEHAPWFMGKSLFAVFLLGWIPALLGLLRLNELPHASRRLLFLIALPLPIVFFWGYVSSRLYFVIAPLLVLLAVHGITSYLRSKTYRIIVVCAVVLVNFGWLFTSDIIRPLF